MLEHTARYISQDMRTDTKPGHLSLATDMSRDPVFLQGKVKDGPSFAAAMLLLGKIVKTSLRSVSKDHSAYQEWVHGKYLEDLEPVRAAQLKKIPKLQAQDAELRQRIREVETEIQEASEKLNDQGAIRKFYDWLYNQDRDAWIVIDPIVSVQPDATYFEGFSIDESVYARVKLPMDYIDAKSPAINGTTNIDFGLGLENELSRIRSYRPLDLTVGAQAVTLETDIGSATEKKIELPESWVQGLLEVQSALSLASTRFKVSAAFVAEIVARLEAEHEKQGPRSLRFKLSPGKKIEVELEPWGETIVDSKYSYNGERSHEIRIWGRRRLLLLKDILPDVSSVDINLLGSGMPSFWAVDIGGIQLQIGLSGWTTLDWASRARFAAFVPVSHVTDQLLTRAFTLLKTHGKLSPVTLATEAGIETQSALAALQRLCSMGKAMFDVQLDEYRWRELYPQFDLNQLNEQGLEERRGVELAQKKAVTINEDSQEGGRRQIIATVNDSNEQTTSIELDADGRVVYAECSCPHFRFHKLREGPCRHMVAVIVS